MRDSSDFPLSENPQLAYALLQVFLFLFNSCFVFIYLLLATVPRVLSVIDVYGRRKTFAAYMHEVNWKKNIRHKMPRWFSLYILWDKMTARDLLFKKFINISTCFHEIKTQPLSINNNLKKKERKTRLYVPLTELHLDLTSLCSVARTTQKWGLISFALSKSMSDMFNLKY